MENYVFFFGKDKPNGYLSNFYPVPFVDHQNNFSCNEQYIMYRKALLFNDPSSAEKILEAETPLKAKKLGRQVANFDDKVWKEHRLEIMTSGLRLKFSQNPKLKEMLLETGDKILAEASPFDKIWGIGYNKHVAVKKDPKDWPGQNLLGFLKISTTSIKVDIS